MNFVEYLQKVVDAIMNDPKWQKYSQRLMAVTYTKYMNSILSRMYMAKINTFEAIHMIKTRSVKQIKQILKQKEGVV